MNEALVCWSLLTTIALFVFACHHFFEYMEYRRERYASINRQLGHHNARLSTLDHDVESLRKQVNALGEDVATAEGHVEGLFDRISKLSVE